MADNLKLPDGFTLVQTPSALQLPPGLQLVSAPQDPMSGSPTAIANRALAQASPGKGMQVSGREQNPRALARNAKMTYADISPNGSMDVSPVAAGLGGAALDAGEGIAGQFTPKAMVENSPLNPLGPLRMLAGMVKLPKQAGEHIGDAINAYRDNDPYTATREGAEGAGDTAQAVSAGLAASPVIDAAQLAARTGAYNVLRKGAVGAMNTVVRPNNAAFAFGREPGAAALDEGAWGFTRNGVLKDVSDALANRTQQLQSAVDGAKGTIDLRPIINDVFNPRIDFLTKHGETAQASALQNLRDNYLDPQQWPNMGNMSPADATAFKRDVGDMVKWSGDPLEASKAETRRSLYGATKDQINQVVPQAAEVNNRVSNLITAQKSLTTAVNRDAVAAPVNLMDLATDAVAGVPGAVVRKVVTSPGPVSIFAQGLNKLASAVRPAVSEAPAAAASPLPFWLRQPNELPPGQYAAPPPPVAGLLPESASNGMQSVPTDIQGAPAIPRYLRRMLPPGQYQAPSSPIGDILDTFGAEAPRSLPPGQYAMPSSSLPDNPIISVIKKSKKK